MQAASTPEPAEAECKSATSNTIFDHIRKKSKDFPTLMLSKSMDSSYEPLILKKMKTSRDQFAVEQLHVGDFTAVDYEPAESGVSPTNTAERCRRILNRTSDVSLMLFAGKRGSPSEKSKILTTPCESSLRFAGEKDSPLGKSKILIKTPAENSLQLAAKRDSPSGNSKMLTTQDECSLGLAGGKDSPLEKSNILIRTPVENPLKNATPVENSQFAAKRDSPSEKSKMLTTLDECFLGLAGGKDSPLEKSSILTRSPVENLFKKGTPVENSPQFTAKRDSPAEKRKFCSSPPIPCFQAAQVTKQFRAAGQPFNIEEYVKDILAKPKDGGSGDSFLNCRSVFSFLY